MKTAPPVAVAGMSFAGVQLQDWVYIATLAWIAFQLCAAIYDRFFKDAKK